MHLTFHGKERLTVVHNHGHHVEHMDDHGHHEQGIMHGTPKESPWVVTLPLVLLAIPSLLVGFFTVQPMLFGGWFGSAVHVDAANDVLAEMGHEFHGALQMALHGFWSLPFGLVVLAFAITTYIYLFNPAVADKIKNALNPFYQMLNHKYWFDAVYYVVFARGGVKLGRLFWKAGDAALIDGVMIDGTTAMTRRVASGMRRLQSGYLYQYAFAMIIGLILLLGGYWLFGSTLAAQ